MNERQYQNVIQPNFKEKLVKVLASCGAHHCNDAGGFVETLLIAVSQADAVMRGHIKFESGNTLMVVTNDADIPILVGDCFITIKQYSKSRLIELVSKSQKVIHRLAQTLLNASSQQQSSKKVSFTKYPLFDRVTYQKMSALMFLFLGCELC